MTNVEDKADMGLRDWGNKIPQRTQEQTLRVEQCTLEGSRVDRTGAGEGEHSAIMEGLGNSGQEHDLTST